MKKILGLVALFGCIPPIQIVEPYSTGVMFHDLDNQSFYTRRAFVDIDSDNIVDYVAAFYDMDKNKKEDIIAFYRIIGLGSDNRVMTKEYAEMLAVDINEDGRPDYILRDLDDNTTLETLQSLSEILNEFGTIKYKSEINN